MVPCRVKLLHNCKLPRVIQLIYLLKNRRSSLKYALLLVNFILALLFSNNTVSMDNTNMSLDELDQQIGQMLLVGFRGFTVDETHPIVQDIQQRHIGGILLFDYDSVRREPRRNIRSPQQVHELTQQLQKFSATRLLIAVDYEGGAVNRLKSRYGFPDTVSAKTLGEYHDTTITYRHSEKMAKTLSEVGINLNFAPVVDVDLNPDNPIIGQQGRSFSSDAQKVAEHAIAFIRGHHQYGVLCNLKHFPGHGSSDRDSHLGLTDITDSWSEIELLPYQLIIDAGLADSIMTAHVFNEQLDTQYPATLSHAIITGILRERLHYDGVVFSDDIEMKAIADDYGLETAVEKAINAGVDMIILGNNMGNFSEHLAKQVFEIIKENVLSGKIPAERIAQAHRRIQQLKQRLEH